MNSKTILKYYFTPFSKPKLIRQQTADTDESVENREHLFFAGDHSNCYKRH